MYGFFKDSNLVCKEYVSLIYFIILKKVEVMFNVIKVYVDM